MNSQNSRASTRVSLTPMVSRVLEYCGMAPSGVADELLYSSYPKHSRSSALMIGQGPASQVSAGSMLRSVSAQNDLVESGGPIRGNTSIGSGGGYGGFYCFALLPGES